MCGPIFDQWVEVEGCIGAPAVFRSFCNLVFKLYAGLHTPWLHGVWPWPCAATSLYAQSAGIHALLKEWLSAQAETRNASAAVRLRRHG